MKHLLNILILICVCTINSHAQNKSSYLITNNEEGTFLIQGNKYKIELPKSSCFESFENSEIRVGKKFVIIHLKDEMENNRGIVIFDKKGNQINYNIVQEQRKLNVTHYSCCVYTLELKGKLYFYDLLDNEGKDYDCYLDSQTDGSNFNIPRYYIFNPKKNTVKVVTLKNPCNELIKSDKINCQ